MRLAIPLLAFAAAFGQTSRDPNAVLEQARSRLQATSRRLQRYVCVETVNRSYYRRATPVDAPASPDPPSACTAQPSGPSRVLDSTDRVHLEVTVSAGRELHSWPGATRFDSRDVDDLIRNGPVATGSFGAYLSSIFDHDGVTFHFTTERQTDGKAVFEYHYQVPVEASHFEVRTGSGWRTVAYEGEFQIRPDSLDLERLTIRADHPPDDAAFCRAFSTLDYTVSRIGDGEVLLPRQAQLEIVHRNGQESTNFTTFDNCREYQAESEVVFDAPTDAAAAAPRTERGRVSLPIGLPVTLALMSPIDTATAAAGDEISAKVVKPVRRPGSKDDLIPVGAVVHGRIRRVERHLLPTPYFKIALAFNRVDVQGSVSAFVARSEADPELAKELGASLALRDTGIWYWGVGTFLFPSSKLHYVVPAGYESKWFTLATGGR
jgi:hypothetical protein